jgi:hypothetical protein
LPCGQRARLLLRFRNLAPDEIALLSNARCLGEGVDVPTLDGVAFIDPRRSTVDIIQAVGRAIRKAPDKTRGTIVLPVFLTDEDPEQALDDSTFRNVWEVLKALRAHDEKLGEELDELRRNLGARRSPPRRPGKIKLDVPVALVGASFAEAFNVRLVECTTESWEFSFGRLLSFVEREGHSRVLSECRDDDGYRLGRWVAHQRQLEKIGQLPDDRARDLRDLPGWIWSTQEADWEEGYVRFLSFVNREGHVRVVRHYRDDDGYRLGYWVGTQRLQYGRGKLAKDRIERLEAVPGWTWKSRSVRKPDWEEGYAHLIAFVQREGHARVPFHYRDQSGYLLGRWAAYQQRLVTAGKLDRDRKQRLEKLPGSTVLGTREAAWEDAYGRLERFARSYGHARVPVGYRDGDGFMLGAWVRKQRSARTNGRLLPERAARLEALPDWTWAGRQVLSLNWDDSYARLVTFVEREGHSRIPGGYRDEDGYRLGRWVVRQRYLQKKDQLPHDHLARLEALPGWVWAAATRPQRSPGQTSRWDAAYARVVHFTEREGHARVPRGYRDDDGFSLGAWVAGQRRQRRKGRLAQEKADRLTSLTGWAWNSNLADWDEGYVRLVRFAEKTGHSKVPWDYRDGDGYRLGAWVHVQRQVRKRGELSKSRLQRLEDLPGWIWTPREQNWEDGYNRLVRFVERGGNARPPASYRDGDGYKLGTWVVSQRQTAKFGKLDPVRAQRLAELPGWTWGARQRVRAR